jgi:hypothetical protein
MGAPPRVGQSEFCAFCAVDRLVQGELTQAEGDGLLKAVQTLASTKLLLVEHGLPPAPDIAGAAGNASFVVLRQKSA